MADQGPTEQFGEALTAALRAGRFPNPNREGCPPADVLNRLAAKRGALPIGDPVHVHVMQCSPCYQFLEGRRGHYRQRRMLAAVAAILVFLASGYGIYRAWPQRAGRNQPELSRAIVDLRPYTVERSERETKAAPQPVRLPAGPIDAVIYLPGGVEPGPYEIRILDSEFRTKATASAAAKVENFETTIQTRLNLQNLPPGKYTLAMRRPGDDWRQFPLLIEPAARRQ